MFRSAVSIVNKLIGSTNQQAKRRKLARARHSIQHCDILEARTLLTSPDLPGFKYLLTSLGDVYLEPFTSHNGGVLSVSLDVNGDGDVEVPPFNFGGPSEVVSLSQWIEPNSTSPVTITLSESYDANEPDLTYTVVLDVTGIELDPVPFIWIAAADGILAGKAKTNTALGTVTLIYREVGETEWIGMMEINDNFESRFPAADGVKDFEFSTVHELATVAVYGPITTINDITQNEIVNPPADPPDPASEGGTTTGDGTVTATDTSGTNEAETNETTTEEEYEAIDDGMTDYGAYAYTDTEEDDTTAATTEEDYEAIDNGMADYDSYAYTDTEDSDEADSLIEVLVDLA